MSESVRLTPSEESGESLQTTESIKEVLNAEQTLLYAFETAGIIKPHSELAQPVDRILDEAGSRGNESDDDNESGNDTFLAKRDVRSLGEMAIDEAKRNEIQQRITGKINEIQTYDEDMVRALRNWGKWYTQKNGVPSVQEILKNLILPDKDADVPSISREASDLAPDVYWMMLREDEEAKKNAEQPAVA